MDTLVSRVKKETSSNNNKQIGHRGPISIVIGNELNQNSKKIMMDVHTMTTESPTKVQINQNSKTSKSITSISSSTNERIADDAYPYDVKELKLKLRIQDGNEKHHKEINLNPWQLKDLMTMLENFNSDKSCCIDGYKLREVDNSSSSTSLENSINKMKEEVTNMKCQISKESVTRIENSILVGENKSSINDSHQISKLNSQFDCMTSERPDNVANQVSHFSDEIKNDQSCDTDKLIEHLNIDNNSKFNFLYQMSKPNRASYNRNIESASPRSENHAMMTFLFKIEKAVESGKIDPRIFIPDESDLKPVSCRGLSSPEVSQLPPAIQFKQTYSNSEVKPQTVKSIIINKDIFYRSGISSTEKSLENRLSTQSVKRLSNDNQTPGIQLKRILKKKRNVKSGKLLSRIRTRRRCLSTTVSKIKKCIPNSNNESKIMTLVDQESKTSDHQVVPRSPIGDELITAKENKPKYRKCRKFEGIDTPKKYSALESLHSYLTRPTNGFWFPGPRQKSVRPKVWPSKTFGIVTKNVYPGKVMGMTILKDTMYFIMENRDKLFYLPLVNLAMNKLYWEKKFPFDSNPKDITSNSRYLFILLANQEILKINTNLKDDSADRWKIMTSSSDVVTLSHLNNDNILAVCRSPSSLVEFNDLGRVIRIINMPAEVNCISHATELSQNRFVVSGVSPPVIYILDSNGKFLSSNTARQYRYSISKPLIMPIHLAVDSEELIYVADYADNKLVILTNQLKFLSTISFENFTCTSPNRLLYDKTQRLMYFSCSRNARWVLTSFKTFV